MRVLRVSSRILFGQGEQKRGRWDDVSPRGLCGIFLSRLLIFNMRRAMRAAMSREKEGFCNRNLSHGPNYIEFCQGHAKV